MSGDRALGALSLYHHVGLWLTAWPPPLAAIRPLVPLAGTRTALTRQPPGHCSEWVMRHASDRQSLKKRLADSSASKVLG